MQQYSSLKLFLHAEKLVDIYKGKAVSPIYIRLKPTNKCNHHCSYCSYGSGNNDFLTANRDQVHHSDMLPWPRLQNTLQDMGKMGVKALTFTGGGEPLTYPHILEAVRLTKQMGIDLALISNGSLLKEELAEEFQAAKWVRISFDNPNAKEYAHNRGISTHAFDAVCNNIATFAKNKSETCVLGINFVIGKNNFKRVYEASGFLHELGVENIKFSGVLSNSANYHAQIKDEVIAQIKRAQNDFSSEKFSIINDYSRTYEDRHFKPLPFSRCYICRLMTSICADSKIYYCFMRAYDSKAMLGDLSQKSFHEIWFSEDFQEKLRNLNPSVDCKNQCVYDNKNQLLHDFFNIDMNHINFI